MRAARLLFPLLLVLGVVVGSSCGPLGIVSVSPTNGASLATTSFTVQIVTDSGLVAGTLAATLNGVPVTLAGGPTTWTAAYNPGAPLRDQNLLVVTGKSTNGAWLRVRNTFNWLPPKARVRRIAQASDLITGPMGHSRIGDWLFENDVARFIVQDAPQRDLHSVGQFGGEIIDAELIGREGRDAFLALSTSLNIETVVNPITITVVNDGQDGTPAILRACGPDDLMDYVNASSQVAQLGASFPAAADDRNYAIDACIEYVFEAGRRDIRMNTTVASAEAVQRRFWPGYYVNGGGTLEQWNDTAQDPVAGLGEQLVTGANLALAYFGFDSSEGVDYGLLPVQIPAFPSSSSFTTSGVSFLLHSQSIATLLVAPAGAPGPLVIPAGQSRTFSAHFAVGDGSASNTSELRAQIDGTPTGTFEGCVTAGGAPLPGARVALGLTTGAVIDHVVAHFVADAGGCFSGRVLAGSYGAVSGKNGFPYEGGAAAPPVHPVAIAANVVTTENFALPATGRLRVNVVDANGDPTPARINVIGFDPSPEPTIFSQVSPLLPSANTGVLNDVSRDRLNTGFAALAFAGANGVAELDVEPGSYQVYVTRGGEWSVFGAPVTTSGGATSVVNAQIAQVLDTTGFVSSDYHVHMVNSPDSRVPNAQRVESFAAEGVDNLIATDHDAITDLAPVIAALGMTPFLHTTIGEEVTSFDYGHFNSYPQAQDLSRPASSGSTDWGGAAAAGADFPSLGSYGLTPAQIEAAVKGKPQNAGLPTVVQINHIDSHFDPLKIDTAQTPPRSNLAGCPGTVANPCPTFYRLNPAVTNFFNVFEALELWNGSNNSHQTQFLDERIGIWMNLLNQGIVTTAIADTDTHSVADLETAGARTWTPSSSDAPSAISDAEIAQAVSGARAVGGQGVYVQARLVEGVQAADFSLGGATLVTATDGSVDLEIHVQAPVWAPYDTIEIYRNASTRVAALNGTTPTLYDAVPTTTLTAGADFSVTTTNVVPSVAGAERFETHLTVPLAGLTRDEWIVVVVKGVSGISAPMFPVFPRNLSAAQNPTLADLVNVTAGEAGVRALGYTNALFVDVDGNAAFDPPGVSVVP